MARGEDFVPPDIQLLQKIENDTQLIMFHLIELGKEFKEFREDFKELARWLANDYVQREVNASEEEET